MGTSKRSQLPREEIRIPKICLLLDREYPKAQSSLHFKNPFQLLIATILSAQCTDARVNKVTPTLFERFPDAKSLAEGARAEIENLIASTGFFRTKAKNIQLAATELRDRYAGKVPETMEQLSNLAGVGRKTANVVLGNAFGEPAGVVVDTHVKRLSFRLGLTKHTNPTKIELDLNSKIPKKMWIDFPHWLILHGRAVCTARSPRCITCVLKPLCPQRGIT